MRRTREILAVLLCASLALAGCGSSRPADPNAQGPNTHVRVTGAFDTRPDVTIPAESPGTAPVYFTAIHGHGPVVTASDTVLFNWVAYFWTGTTSRLTTDTYGGAPQLMGARWLPAPGLQNALVGKTIGSRIVAVLPPAQAGDPAHITIVFVIDLLKAYADNASVAGEQISSGGGSLPRVSEVSSRTQPTVKIPAPAVKPPTTVQTRVLVKGHGTDVASGDEVVAQVTGVYWRTGQVFTSSWQQQGPLPIIASPSAHFPDLGADLVGQRAGSRMLIVIPAKPGLGASDRASAADKDAGALVFVVDILDAVVVAR
jgi:peptidylprolyl isomerase